MADGKKSAAAAASSPAFRPLLVSAPPSEATFYSLPFVEELLLYSKLVEMSTVAPPIAGSAHGDWGDGWPGDGPSAVAVAVPAAGVPAWANAAPSQLLHDVVRARLERERLCEEGHEYRSRSLYEPPPAAAAPLTGLSGTQRAAQLAATAAAAAAAAAEEDDEEGAGSGSSDTGAGSRPASAHRRSTQQRQQQQQPQPPRAASPSPSTASPDGDAAAAGPSPSPDAAPAAGPGGRGGGAVPQSPLVLLHTGLARALGLPPPPPATDEDDYCLDRARYSHTAHTHAAQGVVSVAAEPYVPELEARATHYYGEVAGAARGHRALLSWFEDLCALMARQGFSGVQARCVLLDAVALLETLYELPDDAGDADVEVTVAAVLQDALSAQACAVPAVVLERQVRRLPVQKRVPDAAVVAALQRRLATEKLNKKQQAALQDEIARAPMVTVTVEEDTEVAVEREVMVGPYFSPAEVGQVLEWLAGAVTHWRVLAYAMSRPQPTVAAVERLVVEAPFALSLPPLAEFTIEARSVQAAARRALWEEAAAALAALFEEHYAAPVAALTEEKAADRARVRREKDEADARNRAAALTSEEFGRVEKAYTIRLNRALDYNPRVGALAAVRNMPETEAAAAAVAEAQALAEAEAAEAAALAAANPGASSKTAKKKSAAGGGGGGKGGKAKPGGDLPVVAADEMPLSAAHAFSLADVEYRLAAVEEALEERVQSANGKKKGRK